MSENTNNTLKEKNGKKVGVFICRCGGNIGDVVNCEDVQEELSSYKDVKICEIDTFMCSNTGQNKIISSIESGSIDRVVVASCSPRLHQTTFRRAIKKGGLNPYKYEHVNVREQVSWAHPHTPKEATNKAMLLVKAGVEKVIFAEDLDSIKVPVDRKTVVIGAGIAGLKASLELAKRGLKVDLIEKSPFLGGRVAEYTSIYPTEKQSTDILQSLYDEIVDNQNITIHLNTSIEKSEGYIGNFSFHVSEINSNGVVGELSEEEIQKVIDICPIKIENEKDLDGISPRKAISRPFPGNFPSRISINWEQCTRCGKCKEVLNQPEKIDLNPIIISETINSGTMIISSGFDLYEPYIGEYGFQTSDNVITTYQLIRLLAPGGKFEKSITLNNKKIKNIAFIHCVGSRQMEGVNKPGKNAVLNEYCSRVCCTTALQLANELKTRFSDVNVFNIYQDIRTYGRFQEENYYEKASKNGVYFLKYNAMDLPIVTKNKNKTHSPLLVTVKDQLTFGEEITIPVDLLVLVVGMIPKKQEKLINDLKLAVGSDGFLLEVHPKLQPVEMANAGIMIAGTAQSPKDITESTTSASAAASKAASILSKEYTELEPFVASVNTEICDGNGLCVDECGYSGAIELRKVTIDGEIKNKAFINPILCKGCGACVAVCPREAIDVKGFPLKALRNMVDAFVMEG